MAQYAFGKAPMKRNQKVYANLQKRLGRLVKVFIENKKRYLTFLQGVGQKTYSITVKTIWE